MAFGTIFFFADRPIAEKDSTSPRTSVTQALGSIRFHRLTIGEAKRAKTYRRFCTMRLATTSTRYTAQSTISLASPAPTYLPHQVLGCWDVGILALHRSLT